MAENRTTPGINNPERGAPDLQSATLEHVPFWRNRLNGINVL